MNLERPIIGMTTNIMQPSECLIIRPKEVGAFVGPKPYGFIWYTKDPPVPHSATYRMYDQSLAGNIGALSRSSTVVILKAKESESIGTFTPSFQETLDKYRAQHPGNEIVPINDVIDGLVREGYQVACIPNLGFEAKLDNLVRTTPIKVVLTNQYGEVVFAGEVYPTAIDGVDGVPALSPLDLNENGQADDAVYLVTDGKDFYPLIIPIDKCGIVTGPPYWGKAGQIISSQPKIYEVCGIPTPIDSSIQLQRFLENEGRDIIDYVFAGFVLGVIVALIKRRFRRKKK